MNKYVIILCGGSGSRLWPLSRTSRPKQLLNFGSKYSLLQKTYIRAKKLTMNKNIFFITSNKYYLDVISQLSDVGFSNEENIIIEKIQRNTLPAIAFVSSIIYQKNHNALISVLPSDQSIIGMSAFVSSCKKAFYAASKNYFCLLGVEARSPDVNYGYISIDKKPKFENKLIYQVKNFYEKPNLENAKKYFKNNFLWNSGIFFFNSKILIESLSKFHNDLFNLLFNNSPNIVERKYHQLPDISFDYGLLEKVNNIVAVKTDFKWNDLGNLGSLSTLLKKDNDGNYIKGPSKTYFSPWYIR